MEKTEERGGEPFGHGRGKIPETFPAVALAGLLDLLDPARCQACLFDLLRPGKAGTCCPGCREELPERRKKAFREFRKTRCPGCGLQFQATTGTAFFHARLSPAEIILAAALVAAGADVAALTVALKRGRDTAGIWRGRLEGLSLADLDCLPGQKNGPACQRRGC